MKANTDLVTEKSSEAVDLAREMSIPEPELEYIKREIYFTLHEINAAYVNGQGDIVIYHPAPEIGYWVLDYDDEIWQRIKKHLGS